MADVKIQTTQNVEISYSLAHIGDRILATLLDFLIIFVYNILISFVIGATASGGKIVILLYVILILPAVFYFLLTEIFLNGQSVGKIALNIKVVSLDGRQPTIGQYLVRWIFRLVDISLTFFTVGVICIIATEKAQRLGDIVAGTTVIKLTDRVRLSHADIVPPQTNPAYQVTFAEAAKLSEEDVSLIKEVLNKYYYERNYELLTILADKIKQVYQISTALPPEQFLKKLLDDHTHLVYGETSYSAWKS